MHCSQVVPQHCQNIIWSSFGETSVEQNSLSFRGALIVFKVGGSDSSNTTEILPVSGGPNTQGFIFRLFATIFKQFGQGHHYVTSLQSLLSKTKPNLACVYRWWYHPGSGQVQGLRIFGLACNHTMERITFCRQKCSLVMFFIGPRSDYSLLMSVTD